MDAEKTFHNVNLNWLFLVMEKMGFGGQFANFLRDMYLPPTARILTPGMISDPITLYRENRQGCPLSQLLFNLALDPLARHILNNTDIQGGVRFGKEELKI